MESVQFFMGFQGVIDALWNSILVALVTMILSIGLGAPAGYALARFDFPGKNLFRIMVLMTRAFPLPLSGPAARGACSSEPGLDDTIIGLALVHTVLALPFAILITSSLFMGIPFELEEAAWTLGCTRFQAFRKAVLPLVFARYRSVGRVRLRHLLERGVRSRRAHHREPNIDRVS